MIVACTSCNTKYKIPEDRISSGRVKVRCSKCKQMFFIKEDGEIETDPATPGMISDSSSGVDARGAPKSHHDYMKSESKVPPLPENSRTSVFDDSPSDFSTGEDRSTKQPAGSHRTLPPLPDQPNNTDSWKPAKEGSQDLPRDPFADINLDDDSSLARVIDGAESGVKQSTLVQSPLDSFKDPFADLNVGSAKASGVGTENKVEGIPAAPDWNATLEESDPFSGVQGNDLDKPIAGPIADLEQSSGASDRTFSGNDNFGPSGLELKGNTARNIKKQDLYQADPHNSSMVDLPSEPQHDWVPASPEKPICSNKYEARKDSADARNIIWKVGIWAFLSIVGLLLFVVYRSAGKPEFLSWSTYQQAFSGDPASDWPVDGLEAESVSSTTYKNRLGRELVIVWGEVTNTTPKKKVNVLVRCGILDKEGSVFSQAIAPAGVMFNPLEVYRMTDRRAIMIAYRSKLPKNAVVVINAGDTVPFMLIFHESSTRLQESRFLYSFKETVKPIRDYFTPDLVESKTE